MSDVAVQPIIWALTPAAEKVCKTMAPVYDALCLKYKCENIYDATMPLVQTMVELITTGAPVDLKLYEEKIQVLSHATIETINKDGSKIPMIDTLALLAVLMTIMAADVSALGLAVTEPAKPEAQEEKPAP